jgi:hypothetical protein
MKKLHPLIAISSIFVTIALSSCSKTNTAPPKEKNQAINKTNLPKSLVKNNNYILTGIYYEGPGGLFSTCLYSGPCCMVVCRPVFNRISETEYSMTPDSGDNAIQVDKYKTTGIETGYYSQIDVTIDSNGQETYHYIP